MNLIKKIFPGKENRKLYFSIKYKIVIAVILMLGLFSLFIYYYFPQKLQLEKIKVLQLNSNSSAKMAAYGIAEGMKLKNYKPSDVDIQRLVEHNNLRYLIIYKGEKLFYELNYEVASLNDYRNVNEDIKNIKIIKAHSEIISNGEYIGELYVGFSPLLIDADKENVKRHFRNISTIIFTLGTILVFVSSKILVRPLKKLVDSVNEVSEGKFTEHVNIKSNDELGILADSFNNMLDQITLSNSKNEKINKELEKRVRERTREFENLLLSSKKENLQRQKAEKEISRSLNEKEILLKEIHHRVKNNLQIVSSLFFFQSKQVKDPKMLDLLRDGQNRVKSMALIHKKLYQSSDLANIDFKEYISKLSKFLFQSYNINQSKIRLKMNVQEIKLGVDVAVPCGLIINEVISNSLKHAFKNSASGDIKIAMGYLENRKLMLKINDNGKGISGDFDIEKSNSLGLRLVNNLTAQLNGNISFKNNNGTEVKLIF